MKTNIEELREEIIEKINKIKEEHCGNCEPAYTCNTCFPNFIELTIKETIQKDREALLKDVDEKIEVTEGDEVLWTKNLHRDGTKIKPENKNEDFGIICIGRIGAFNEIKQLFKKGVNSPQIDDEFSKFDKGVKG